MLPGSLRRSRLAAFRGGCVRTKRQAVPPSLQARAKYSTVYWYEHNALAKRADPRLEQVYSGPHPGQCLQLENITAEREFGWIVARM
jgi:hypothetical protein